MNILASMRYLVALDKHRHFGRAAANINNHMARSRADWNIRANGCGNRFFNDVSGSGSGGDSGIDDSAPFG